MKTTTTTTITNNSVPSPAHLNHLLASGGKTQRLELFEQVANNRCIVTETDYARQSKPFERNTTAKGITFKTKNGSFKLTSYRQPNGTIFDLVNLKDKSRLTARLVIDPDRLCEFRTYQNFMTATQGYFGGKFNRTSPSVPCLIIEWKEATCVRSDLNREILPLILTAAAFGYLKYWRRIARRVRNLISYSPPAGPRPFLDFSSGETAPAASGSAQ